ncbi:acetyl/propionyl/methylcrotonyl-CoA carboxylase subunit alpha [Zooshikella ganghwensis]|uniref:Biotin carboxylase n=1 Tax=Zooshikella ganghwensis TaxID=202772 RepID=A0A4P9VQG3_9GAMM|nr:acetyl-CoA carboxylase biotin carboxylase subunit [Zooshikella ganghwensis]RDH44322.1 acetyl-CoA carboxylase biotin carboxylase subunit [Zooshikella ganghwensis]
MMHTLLIANRGEIACRVIRTAQAMGIRCVAVYSSVDQHALHVQLADEAYALGPAPAAESYLNSQKILTIAKQAGADAIHPGYGFLSENADFAATCQQAGITFVGPPAEAIHMMGSKQAAKQHLQQADVPLLPGYHGQDQSLAAFQQSAQEIGYPVLLKAAAGGGGKGMRIVHQVSELATEMAAAQREAKKSFGDDTLLLEKYLAQPRHIEIQIFMDQQGHGVSLFERDCSLQRRHQKIVEEAPAPGLSAKLRERMGEAALRAAKAIGYVGAGTVEFLLSEDEQFYFMEMNTRLQVEHPVTELITNQDLVEWQLRIAQGEHLPCRQQQLAIHGHAIELRLYAESPQQGFLPATGTINRLSWPELSHLRIDTGVQQGDDITIHYDPLIAKIISWGATRPAAIQRLQQALSKLQLQGVTTNQGFLYRLLQQPEVRHGQTDTQYVERLVSSIQQPSEQHRNIALIGAALTWLDAPRSPAHHQTTDPYSPWRSNHAWRLNQPNLLTLTLHHEQQAFTIAMREIDAQTLEIALADESQTCHFWRKDNVITVQTADQHRHTLITHYQLGKLGEASIAVQCAGEWFHFKQQRHHQAAEDETGSELTAPMPGSVVALLVKPGDAVAKNTPLLILEAMKMEHTIRAPAAGKVTRFNCQPGALVTAGFELLDFESADTESSACEVTA